VFWLFQEMFSEGR